MSAVPARVAMAIERTKKIWAVCMVFAILFTVLNLPFWLSIFLIPLGVLTYFGSITVTMIAIASKMPKEELMEETVIDHVKVRQLHEDLDSGKVAPGSDEMFARMKECGLTDEEVTPIVSVSDELVGHIDGQPMYEWVDLPDPITKKTERFFYSTPAHYDKYGNPDIPKKEGFIYAHINGVFYAREL